MINPIDIESAAKIYASAKPFPHIVIQNFMDADILTQVLNEFPSRESKKDVEYRGLHEHKDVICDRPKLGAVTNRLVDYLNSQPFIDILNKITGIERPLIGDRKLMGGGLHEIPKGGYLKCHADFNKHYETGYDRRVNLLLYMNKDWKEEYGGHIELWNLDMTKCESRTLPTFNTCVIFNTTDFSWHGHPDPITCPDGMTRKSLAMYYYSKGRPQHELNPHPHNSIWKARKGIDDWEDLVT